MSWGLLLASPGPSRAFTMASTADQILIMMLTMYAMALKPMTMLMMKMTTTTITLMTPLRTMTMTTGLLWLSFNVLYERRKTKLILTPFAVVLIIQTIAQPPKRQWTHGTMWGGRILAAMITSELLVIMTTDDESWKASTYNNKHIRVEQLSMVEALDKYEPMQPEGNGEMTRLIDDWWTVPPPTDGEQNGWQRSTS